MFFGKRWRGKVSRSRQEAMAMEAMAAREALSAPPGSNTVFPGSPSEKLHAGSLRVC